MARVHSLLVACALALLAVAVFPAAAQSGCSRDCFKETAPNYVTGGGFYYSDPAACDPSIAQPPFLYCLDTNSTSYCRQCKTPLTTQADDPLFVLPDCPQCVLDRYPQTTAPAPPTTPGSPAGSPPSGVNLDAILSCINQSSPNFQTGVGYQYYDPICYTEVSILCVQQTGCRLCGIPPSTSTRGRRLLQAPAPGPAPPLCPAYICDYFGASGCAPAVGPPVNFDVTTLSESIRLTGPAGQLNFTQARQAAFQEAIANVLGPSVSPSNVVITNVTVVSSGGSADVVDVFYQVTVPTVAADAANAALDVNQNSDIILGQLAAAGLGVTAVGLASTVSGPAVAPSPAVPVIELSYVTGAFEITTLTDNATVLDPILYSQVVAAALNLPFLYPENITLTSVTISSQNDTVTTLVANYTIVVLSENEPALLNALNNIDLSALAAAFTLAGVGVTSIVPFGSITTVETTAPAPSFAFAPAPAPGNAAFAHIANKYLIGAVSTLVALILMS